MAVTHELEQIVEKLGHAGGADKVFEIQFAKAPAQVDPKVLIIDHVERPVVFAEKVVAILMKGRDPQTGQVSSPQLLPYSLAHLLGRILGVGDGKDFVGAGMSFADQASNALGQDGGLPCT